MVDVIGQLRIEISQWVVGQRCQVYHRVKALQVGPGKIAEIFADFGNRFTLVAEIAARIEIGVETCDLVAGGTQERTRDGADVALMTSQQNLHYDSYS